ncbi:MAG: ATP-binding protein [Thermus sp.]|uniref:ATP-binding protein n=1 Tax=Thermus sp. TaxID=275 RepID=UPI003D14EB8F
MARAIWLPVLALALGLWLGMGLEAHRQLTALALEEAEALAEAAAKLSNPEALSRLGVRLTARPREAAPLWGERASGAEVTPRGIWVWAAQPRAGGSLEVARVYPFLLPSPLLPLGLALLAWLWAWRRCEGEVRRALGAPLNEARERLADLTAAFASLEEGVAVLKGQEVVLLNPKGLALLGLPPGALPPLPLRRVWPALADHREEGEAHLPLPTGRPGRVRLQELGNRRIAVFQEQAELFRLAEELTQSRRHLELLRAQAHEFQNLLHVLGGLLELGRAEEALHLVQGELAAEKELESLLRGVEVPLVAALLLGKVRRARERGLGFRLEGRLPARFAPMGESLASILGHLLENALEAAQSEVGLRFLEREGLRVEVLDDGPGLPPGKEAPFLPGASGRGAGRGYGLALARAQARALGGEVGYHRREGWTVFWLSLPEPSSWRTTHG